MSSDQDGHERPSERRPLLTNGNRRDEEEPNQPKQRSTLFTVCPFILGDTTILLDIDLQDKMCWQGG